MLKVQGSGTQDLGSEAVVTGLRAEVFGFGVRMRAKDSGFTD